MRKQAFGKKGSSSLPWLLLVVTLFTACTQQTPEEQKKKKIEKIVASLTLPEKAEIVIGVGRVLNLPDSVREKMGLTENLEELGPAYAKMVRKVRDYVPGVAGNTAEFPDKGVYNQVLSDGPAGLRIQPTPDDTVAPKYCTAFPIGTVLASSWDTALVRQVGKTIGNEVLEYGVDVILGPGMNIQRDPLCGRNFEYYSEDPLVAGKIAAAMVKGVQSNGVGTSIKHFALNNQETQRNTVNVIVSERALREIYLKGFEIAVKDAQPLTVMSSYNKINGTYTAESHDLLTKILRDDWGFKGYVMTDWGGGSDVVKELQAGNDLVMPGKTDQVKTVIDAVQKGELSEAVLDQDLSRILNVMMRLPKYRHYQYSDKPDLKAHAQVTRNAATDGMVLLKNTGQTLPVQDKVKKMAVFGNCSYDIISGGIGSGDVQEAYIISMIDGLKNAGYTPDAGLIDTYENYMKVTREKLGPVKDAYIAMRGGQVPLPEMEVSRSLAEKMAIQSDMAIITIGRNSGEGRDRKAIEGDFYLAPAEMQMIRNVSEAFHAKGKKAVVILNIGGAIETSSWRDYPDAILCAWQPGQEAGNSIADVLSGKVNPSGKLAVTFPVKYDDVPSSKYFPGHKPEQPDSEADLADVSGFSNTKRIPWEVTYAEDIYVGYRYYNTFHVPVAYEFGYGLSYTNFDYSNCTISTKELTDNLTVTVDVKNVGRVAGREVAEVYLSAPDGKLEKPAGVLVAFAKTTLLQPGESQTLTFPISAMDMASFDEDRSSWIIEPGQYAIKVGASCKDIRGQEDFSVAKEIVVSKVSKALVPNRKFKRLTKETNL